jgi:hypothetical protein
MVVCREASAESRSFAGVQSTNQSGGGQSATLPMSSSRPSPNPTPDQQSGAQGPKLPSRPTSKAAGTPRPPQTKPSSDREVRAGSRAKPGEAEPSEASPNPKPAGKGMRHVGASPGRRVAGSPGRRRAWTCAGCGITAEESEKGKLQECTGCRSVRYCGKACQKMDWPTHKPTCKRLQAGQA